MATPLVVGETYELSYTISAHTAGKITPSCGGVTMAPSLAANGTYYHSFTASSTASLVLTGTPTAIAGGSPGNHVTMTVDTISLKLVTGALVNIGTIDSTTYKVGGVAGFTGTAAYNNFTIVGGIITAASV
jgi:hypothetical protein